VLLEIYIRNYALIKELRWSLASGFTVITGETGAGKSLLLESLALLTGNRAAQDKPGDPNSKSIVEGIFALDKEDTGGFFQENDLDFNEETIIRREIIPGGRSRAFINDTPVNLSILKTLGDNLVDIHSQHDVQRIVQPEHQLRMLDMFSNIRTDVRRHEKAYLELKKKEKELLDLQEEQRRSQSDLDYWQFQLEELISAQLDVVDFESLKASVNRAENTELIHSEVGSILHNIQKEDDGILDLLREGKDRINKLKSIAPEFQSLSDRLDSLNIELEDLTHELNLLLQIDDQNSGEIEGNKESLDELNRLMYKHSVQSLDELKELKNSLEYKVANVESGIEKMEHLKNQINIARKDIDTLTRKLTKERQKGAIQLQKQLMSDFQFLNLENALIELDLRPKELSGSGADRLDIKFTANPGRKAESLSKVASGGERSRLMLTLKKAFSEKGKIPTMVLDEIDTGIYGETALKVGEFLQKMSSRVQIVAVTHLAQVAGRADHHYYILKRSEKGQTISQLKHLKAEEKTTEIARLIGGDEITTSAKEQALWLQGKMS
jgi:DNA repair protein RecN (Recombination protein N)